MNSFDSWSLIGRRCAAVSRVVHQFTGQAPTPTGPLELTWDDGLVTVVDVHADWTLNISIDPWVDPYLQAGSSERDRLGRELGLWSRRPADASNGLSALVGATVTAVEPRYNEVDELVGIDIAFDAIRLTITQWAGDLVVHTPIEQ